MDIASVVGVLLAFALLVIAVAIAPGASFAAFIDYPSIMVVCGGATAAVTVSVTEAVNTSTGVTQALVTGSDISGADFDVSAVASGEISVVGVAASISAAAGSDVGVSLTASAVDIDNVMNNTVAARVFGGQITSGAGVTVIATDSSKINAVGVAASIAISVGSSASIGAGVSISLVDNVVNTNLEAVLGGDATITAGGGAVVVTATNLTEINAVAESGPITIVFEVPKTA